MKKSTLYKLLGYAALLVILVMAGDFMQSTASPQRLLVYLCGGSMMYWGVIVWMYGRKHRGESDEDGEPAVVRKKERK